MTVSAFALTLSDIETQIRRHIRDTSTTASLQQYSDTVLDGYINEVQREVVNMTWCIEKSTGITLVSGTTYYSMPTNMIVPMRVTFDEYDAVPTDLEETSLQKLYVERPSFESDPPGSPAEYFIRTSTKGATHIEMGFIPAPGATSTGTVKIDYKAQVTAMASDSDVPFDGLYQYYAYHDLLIYGVVVKVKLIQGKVDEATVYAGIYNALIQTMKARLNESPNFRPDFQGKMK